MNRIPLFLFLLLSVAFHAQVKENIYDLNGLENLLTEDVKNVVTENIKHKQTVFLGEAVHYSGSDFLAKAEFVKYLVNEHGYKDIAFESDFFALYFNHSKTNLYKFWSVSDQCIALMDFLKKNNVTLWGFDNQMHSYYSKEQFTVKLSDFLKANAIPIDEKFMNLTKTLLAKDYDSNKFLTDEEVAYLKKHVSGLLSSQRVQNDVIWKQLLQSFETTIELYTVKNNNDDRKGVIIRDRQMAKNLDFLVKQNPNKKFIVWLANAHMSKCNYESMKGITMGAQFRNLSPESSYHIAFGTMRMPPERSEKSILKTAQNKNSILNLLPSVTENYFLDVTRVAPESRNQTYADTRVFNLGKKNDLLNHFDALVFLSDGIEVSYKEYEKKQR